MVKKILKGIGIVFLALIIIGGVFGEEPTEPTSTLPAQTAETEQTESTLSDTDLDQGEPAAVDEQSIPASTESVKTELKADAVTESEPTTSTTTPPTAHVSGSLKVHYIDVGQADSILIQAPSGKSMLIDAGNNSDGQAVVNYVKNQGISKLDIVVGTHPHEDHIGGLDTVINSLDIGQVVMPNVTHTTQAFKDVLTAVQNKGLKITSAKPGVSLDLGEGVSTSVLAPVKANYNELNDYSAVIRLAFGGTSFLFTGDAEAKSESDMISSGTSLSATVLKVGHHGSATSSSQPFLNKVKPSYAVIMAGKDNSYGHPDQEVLNRLTNIGAKIFRTDINGTIIATSDGSTVTFNTSPTEVKASAPSPAPAPAPTPAPTPSPPPPTAKPDTPPPATSGNENVIVYKTKTGTKYHLDGCSSLSRSKIEITLKDAKAQNLGPCDRCNPPK